MTASLANIARPREESAESEPDLTALLAARKAFAAMEQWALSLEAQGLAEHEVERQLAEQGREVCRQVLQAHLILRGTGDVGRKLEVQRAEAEARAHRRSSRQDPKQIVSVFGEVQALRTAYRAGGVEAVHPLDETLGLAGRSFSYELQRRAVFGAVAGPFAEVVETLAQSTGHRLAKRSAEQLVRDAAQDFDRFYEERLPPSPAETGPFLLGSFDGKGIPLRKREKTPHQVRLKRGEKRNKKRMATVAAVYSQQPKVRTPVEVVNSLFDGERPAGQERVRAQAKRVWASLEQDKETVIAQGLEEMRRRDPAGVKDWAILTDGERGLQRQVRQGLSGVRLILDLIHALERIWIAAHALYQEGSKEATGWARTHALMLLQGKVSQVVKGLRQSVTKRKLRGSPRRAILVAAAYLYRNRAHMKYDVYLALGLPIATGVVEGACKHLVKDRMERSGMRWTPAGAEAMLKLRALKLSGDLDDYWQFHLCQDQKRLYGARSWRVAV